MTLEIQNRTAEDRDFHVRVRRAPDLDADLSTEFETSGTVPGLAEERRFSEEFEDGWTAEPGRFAVDVSLDGGPFRTEDVTERLVQEDGERICYDHLVAIEEGSLDSLVDVDASCPDGVD